MLARFHAAVSALENEVARDWLLLMMFTGLRKEAAASLRWDRVDLTQGTVTVWSKRRLEQFTLPLGDYPHALLKRRWETASWSFKRKRDYLSYDYL